MLMKVYSMMDLMMVRLTLRIRTADMTTQVYMAVDMVSSFTLCWERSSPETSISNVKSSPSTEILFAIKYFVRSMSAKKIAARDPIDIFTSIF